MRKISKANKATFLKRATELLKSKGAVEGKGILEPRYASFVLHTVAGDMTIDVEKEPEYMYTVFCCFAEPRWANELGLIGLNPYSGKYNFHLTGIDVNEVVDSFNHHIERVYSSTALKW